MKRVAWRDWSEALAVRLLAGQGFTDIVLNTVQNSHPYAGILASRRGNRYLFSVKARKRRFKHGAVRSSYEIASENIIFAAKSNNAIPAWLIIQVDRRFQVYSAYWGIISDLPGNQRSDDKLTISLRDEALHYYNCMALNQPDEKIPEMFRSW